MMRLIILAPIVATLTLGGCDTTTSGAPSGLARKPGRTPTIVVIRDLNDNSTAPQDVADDLVNNGYDVVRNPQSGATVNQGAEVWHVNHEKLARDVCQIVNGRYHGSIIRKIGGFGATHEPFGPKAKFRIKVKVPKPGGPGPAAGTPCRVIDDPTEYDDSVGRP